MEQNNRKHVFLKFLIDFHSQILGEINHKRDDLGSRLQNHDKSTLLSGIMKNVGSSLKLLLFSEIND